MQRGAGGMSKMAKICNVSTMWTTPTEDVVDGSNESLYHADEEMHPLLRTFSPLQTIFRNLDVQSFVEHP